MIRGIVEMERRRLVVFFLFSLMVISSIFPSLTFAETPDKVETEDGHEIGFGTPVLSTNTESPKTELVEENIVEQTIVIEPSDNRITVEIPLELQNGEYIVLGEDEQGNSDGAAMIYNEENESIGILSSPVLENEENLNVVSVTKKDDNTLEYTLESDGLSEPTTMLVTLAATSYSSYFSSGKWITRDGKISLSLTHKPYLLSGSTNDKMFKLSDSWNKVVAKHKSSSHWKNQTSLYNQYACHYGYAPYKNPWNIEPWRPNVGLTKTIAKGCNP
jgi:Protein of unknown function (DUF2599)